MKFKQLFFAGLFTFGLLTCNVQALNNESVSIIDLEDHVPSEYEKLILQGTLMMGVGPDAIEGGANSNSVYLYFTQSFGNVNIAIYNSNGQQVYCTVVDTSIQRVVIIPFSTAAPDAYTIVLNHAGDYAEGDFEKNQTTSN